MYPFCIQVCLIAWLIAPNCERTHVLTALFGKTKGSRNSETDDRYGVYHPYAHQITALVVGYLLVLRANIAYQRFWEGRSSIQSMSAKWGDATAQLINFETWGCSEKPTQPGGAKRGSLEFRRSIVLYMSALHGIAIQALRGDKDLRNLIPVRYSSKPTASRIRDDEEDLPEFRSVMQSGDDSTVGAWDDEASGEGLGGLSAHFRQDMKDEWFFDYSTWHEAMENKWGAMTKEAKLSWWETWSLGIGFARPNAKRLGQANPLAVSEALPEAYIEQIASTRHRVLLAMQVVMNDISRRRQRVPAPILSRTYQVLSDGMLGFMHARKIMDTPLPFPYTQICEALLLVICVSVPFVICATIEEPWLIYCFNSVTICGFIGLNEAARELENPFGYDPNDLELTILQADFTERCMSLLLAPDFGFEHYNEEEAEEKPPLGPSTPSATTLSQGGQPGPWYLTGGERASNTISAATGAELQQEMLAYLMKKERERDERDERERAGSPPGMEGSRTPVVTASAVPPRMRSAAAGNAGLRQSFTMDMLRKQAADEQYVEEAEGALTSPKPVPGLREDGLGSHDNVFSGERITMDQATHTDTRYHRIKAERESVQQKTQGRSRAFSSEAAPLTVQEAQKRQIEAAMLQSRREKQQRKENEKQAKLAEAQDAEAERERIREETALKDLKREMAPGEGHAKETTKAQARAERDAIRERNQKAREEEEALAKKTAADAEAAARAAAKKTATDAYIEQQKKSKLKPKPSMAKYELTSPEATQASKGSPVTATSLTPDDLGGLSSPRGGGSAYKDNFAKRLAARQKAEKAKSPSKPDLWSQEMWDTPQGSPLSTPAIDVGVEMEQGHPGEGSGSEGDLGEGDGSWT